LSPYQKQDCRSLAPARLRVLRVFYDAETKLKTRVRYATQQQKLMAKNGPLIGIIEM